MTHAEELRAAIAKLTGFAEQYGVENGWLFEVDTTTAYPGDPRTPLTRDPYAVTLHTTIPAQLAILAEGAHFAESGRLYEYMTALTLARAINGTEPE